MRKCYNTSAEFMSCARNSEGPHLFHHQFFAFAEQQGVTHTYPQVFLRQDNSILVSIYLIGSTLHAV